MATFLKEINNLADYFKKVQPVERILFRWLYLSPEARTERLKELMLPVSAKKS
ncbi:hypothetical protein JD422_22420 [Leclercia adecarboxylata]|nr:hypothetical protein [Leclercia adecarboxylata]MBK0353395.1 hypothetical protein [Leclercia adecarboxylata]